jgi:myosin heavy subunit
MQTPILANLSLISQAKFAGEQRRLEKLKFRAKARSAAKTISTWLQNKYLQYKSSQNMVAIQNVNANNEETEEGNGLSAGGSAGQDKPHSQLNSKKEPFIWIRIQPVQSNLEHQQQTLRSLMKPFSSQLSVGVSSSILISYLEI